MNIGEFKIRAATLDEEDIETTVRHRRAMFFEMGQQDERALEEMSEKFRVWLRGKMAAGEYLGWFSIAPDESVAAGAGLWLMDWPPHMIAGGKWRGNILNVYTETAYRRQGLARQLMKEAIEWCAREGVGEVILHASPAGRALYEDLGFEGTNEMRLRTGLDGPEESRPRHESINLCN